MKIRTVVIGLFAIVIASYTVYILKNIELAYEELPETIDLNLHIKPLLSDKCYSGHILDENTQKVGLRLDKEEEVFSKIVNGSYAIVSGKSGTDSIISGILSDDSELQMPLPTYNVTLSINEKAMLVKWIDQGAEWKNHRSLSKQQKPTLLNLLDHNWMVQNEIDLFVQQRLKEEGFEPMKRKQIV